MKPDGFAVGFRAEPISHYGLKEDKIPLQAGGHVGVGSTGWLQQFAG